VFHIRWLIVIQSTTSRMRYNPSRTETKQLTLRVFHKTVQLKWLIATRLSSKYWHWCIHASIYNYLTPLLQAERVLPFILHLNETCEDLPSTLWRNFYTLTKYIHYKITLQKSHPRSCKSLSYIYTGLSQPKPNM
jgi:hypothetical protein